MTTASDHKPFVSVIIPVFNDGERLRKCLAALEAQSYPADRFEVIVVDNGSRQSPESIVREYPHAQFTQESKPGSYCARNKGLSLAKGDVLAFTDADCVPQPTWLERGVATLEANPAAGLVAGRIKVFFKDPQKPSFVEFYESVRAFPQHDYIKDHKYGATANLFTTRAMMDRMGPFNETLKSSGDKEWGNRVFKAGLPQIYAHDAVVEHPARYSFKELYNKIARITAGHWQLQGRPRYSLLRFLIDLRPPVQSVLGWAFDRNMRLIERVKVITVFTFIRWVTAWETFRLTRGAAATR